MKKKFVAVLACRNKSQRLYGKPLQNLDIKKNLKIIDLIIYRLKKIKFLNSIVLAISNKKENLIYTDIAKKHSVNFFFGDDKDVLSRLIYSAEKVKATDILRVTSESPFTYFNNLHNLWKFHSSNNMDGTFFDNIVDGCGYEIISVNALKKSHLYGKSRHKSELCTLYMRENNKKFKIKRFFPPKNLFRSDIRLTVDNPEDLIVCRLLYKKFKYTNFNLLKMINFLDKKKYLKSLLKPFCFKGYGSMYKWKK